MKNRSHTEEFRKKKNPLYSNSLSIELASGMAVEVWQTGVHTDTLLAQQVNQKR
jgi:hypothetical protein